MVTWFVLARSLDSFSSALALGEYLDRKGVRLPAFGERDPIQAALKERGMDPDSLVVVIDGDGEIFQTPLN